LKATERRDENDFRNDCSQIIDILQEICGSENYIRSFKVEYHYGYKCQTIINGLDLTKNHVIFTPSGRRAQLGAVSSGHFHFVNKFIGNCQDSYSLGWQTAGSNGFCQTFALMGSLGMGGVFKGKTKEECSIVACQYILDNGANWYKNWNKLCTQKGYENIMKLSLDEIKTDLHMCMAWRLKKGRSTLFWDLG
jgi:hypothetical protein